MSCWRLLRKLLTWTEVHATRDHDKKRLNRWKTRHTKLLEQVKYTSSVQAEFWEDDAEPDEFITDAQRDEIEKLDPKVYNVHDMLDETLDDLEQLAEFLRLVNDKFAQIEIQKLTACS